MMSGDQKSRVTPVFLIIFLLIVNLLTNCSGCSKSGRRIPADNDTALVTLPLQSQIPPWLDCCAGITSFHLSNNLKAVSTIRFVPGITCFSRECE